MHQWICLNELYELMGNFFFFKFVFEFFGQKTKKFQKNIDQIAMCYISMDLSRQALQTNGKFFFFLIQFSFQIIGRKSKNIQAA